MTNKEKEKLKEFCINILAHCEIDSDVDIPLPGGGMNGVNSSEASTVADAILHMFNIKVKEQEIKRLQKRMVLT